MTCPEQRKIFATCWNFSDKCLLDRPVDSSLFISLTHTLTHTQYTLSYYTHTVGVCNKLTMLHLLQVAEAFTQTTRSLRPNIRSVLKPLSLKFIGTIQGWCRRRLERNLPLSHAHCCYMKYAEHQRQRQSQNRKHKGTLVRNEFQLQPSIAGA